MLLQLVRSGPQCQSQNQLPGNILDAVREILGRNETQNMSSAVPADAISGYIPVGSVNICSQRSPYGDRVPPVSSVCRACPIFKANLEEIQTQKNELEAQFSTF